VVHDEAHGGMAAGERDQIAGAGDVDEPQAGQVQVDVTGAIYWQRDWCPWFVKLVFLIGVFAGFLACELGKWPDGVQLRGQRRW
jgi:hypothetical protein